MKKLLHPYQAFWYLLWLLLAMILTVGCMKSQNSQLSTSQLNAVQELTSSYQRARLSNDSLIVAVNRSDSTAIYYYDKKYHDYVLQFDNCHGLYEHNTISANHSHNAMGDFEMHNANANMMNRCQCCTNGGHSADLHQQMQSLHELHLHYHPH